MIALALLGPLSCASARGELASPAAPDALVLAADEVSERIAELGTERFEEAVAALVALGRPAVNPLIETLRTAELDVAWQAARVLRALGSDASSGKAKLTILAGDESAGTSRRGVACFALGGSGAAAGSAAGTLAENLSGEASELQLLSAIALIEVGRPAATPLGKVVKDPDDLFAAVWALAALAHLGDDAKGAAPSLKKVVEDRAFKGEAPYFALRRAGRVVLDELDVAYEPALEWTEIVTAEDMKASAIPGIFRGGRLDAELSKDPSRVRTLLSSLLGMTEAEAERLAIALPERFEDYDDDGYLTAGELIQGLVAHLAQAIGPLSRSLSAGELTTYGAWQQSSAALAGLSFVLRTLSTPEFLEKSHAVRAVLVGWDGLYPPEGSIFVFMEG